MSSIASKPSLDKEIVANLAKLKSSNIFSVRARLYQKIAGISGDVEWERSENITCAEDLLNGLINDMAILSRQPSASDSEWECFFTLTYICLKILKEKCGERYVSLLTTFVSCHSETPKVNLTMVQCCIEILRYQRTLKASMKKQFLEVSAKAKNLATSDFTLPQNLCSDFISLLALLLNEDENIQIVVLEFVNTLSGMLIKFTRDQKIAVVKSVDTEKFRNHMRNLSRSPTLHHVVADLLLALIRNCGDVLHSATLANVLLAWASYLVKSLIHDAAISFYTVWTAVIDNFSQNKAVLLSPRHRKLVLLGFGSSLANAKLRTAELLAAKIRTWWHFIVQISYADSKFLGNPENFTQIVAPLLNIVSGDILAFKLSDGASAVLTTPSRFQLSEFSKLALANQQKCRDDLIALLCDILFSILSSSLGHNGPDKLDAWLRNKYPVIPSGEFVVEQVARATSFGLEATMLAPAICSTVCTVFSELCKLPPAHCPTNADVSILHQSDILANPLRYAFARIFSGLLFWLASSVECSQNTGTDHWKRLFHLLESFSSPQSEEVVSGLSAAFISELPSVSFLTCSDENARDEPALRFLTRLVDCVSKAANSVMGTSTKHPKESPISNNADPSPSINCIEAAIMKLLSSFRKSSVTVRNDLDWKTSESICTLICRQNPAPPAYVVYCWIHNWQRLGDIAESWGQSACESATFTSFLALPFKLLRLCPVANGAPCCRVVGTTHPESGPKLCACKCSSCRRLLDKDFMTTLATRWRHLFNLFCNAPDTDTPRLSRGSDSVAKLCSKLLKCMKPSQSSSGALPLSFLTFAALCFDSIREKALAAGLSSVRRTSRVPNQQQIGEANSIFIRCITEATKETAESLTAVVAFAEHIHKQCKKAGTISTAPLGFTVHSAIKSIVSCVESQSSSVSENSLNGFANAATSLIPAVCSLLAASARVVESVEAGVCCLSGSSCDSDFSQSSICETITDAARRTLANFNRYTDVKNALLSNVSEDHPQEASRDANISQCFSDLVTMLNDCKLKELKNLAREISHQLLPPDSKEKHALGSELLQACAVLPESQNVNSSQKETMESATRKRTKRAPLSSRKDDIPLSCRAAIKEPFTAGMFGSLLTSPTKVKAGSPSEKAESSPLFSPPKRRPNTISTTGRGRSSTGTIANPKKRPSSVLGKTSQIDMEQSCDFVVVEASQDPFESAKKRKIRATEHQLEVMETRQSDIPHLFNTLDADSLISASLSIGVSEDTNNPNLAKQEKACKKRIVALRKFVPMISRMSLQSLPTRKSDIIAVSSSEDVTKAVQTTDNKAASPDNVPRAASPAVNESSILVPDSCDDTVKAAVLDASPADLFPSFDQNDCTLLQMDITVVSEATSDEEADEVESATMMLLADTEEMATNMPPQLERQTPSPDIVESSLEATFEAPPLLSSLVNDEASEKNATTELTTSTPKRRELCSSTVNNIMASSSPTRQMKTETTTENMEITSTHSENGNDSPLHQTASSITMAIVRANRVTPSSPGILKRPSSNGTFIVDTPSPARKSRHVSFSAKTYVKEISPINAANGHESVFSSWRSSRAQLHHQDANTSMPPPPPPLPTQSPSSIEATSPKVELSVAASSCNRASSVPEHSSVANSPSVVDVKVVYPALVSCARPISEILPQIAPTVQFQHGLLALLRAGGIRTIGDIAKLNVTEVRRLPIRTPQVEVLKSVLGDFEKRSGFQREGISRMQLLLCSRNAFICDSSTPATNIATENAASETPVLLSAPGHNPASSKNEKVAQSIVIVEASQQMEKAPANIRSLKVDVSGVDVDYDYVVNRTAASSKVIDSCSQTDEYSIAAATIIDQLHFLTSKPRPGDEFMSENCALIAAYSRWCQRVVCPK